MKLSPLRGRAVAILAFALEVSSCAGQGLPCFNGSSLVTGPQILAVRVDPPETIVDLSGADPMPVGISALVVSEAFRTLDEYGYAPQITDLPVTMHLCLLPSVAVVNAQPGCPAGSLLVASLPSVPDIAAPFVFTPPLALIQQAVDQDAVHGLAGAQLLLQLEVDTSAGPLLASTSIHYLLKGSKESLNHDLQITGIESSKAGVHIVYNIETAVYSIVAQTIGLRPLIGPAGGGTEAVETYQAYNNEGVLTQFVEHVTYAFYDGNQLFLGQEIGGRFDFTNAPGSLADEPPAGSPDPPDGLVSMAAVYPRDQGGTFWVVARDDRGAVTWAQLSFFAKELRPKCIPFGGGCPKINFGCQ